LNKESESQTKYNYDNLRYVVTRMSAECVT